MKLSGEARAPASLGAQRRSLRFLTLMLLMLSSSAARWPSEPLQSLRRIYLEAVEQESAIDRGLAAVETLRAAEISAVGGEIEGVLTAYEGAFITLRAKHAFWPHVRLRHLRNGLALMDAAVASHPHVAEVRYLRLMSCYYLPSILGRSESVREDFAALSLILPTARGQYPPELYRTIVRFVVENGRPTEEARRELEAAIAAVGQ